jgi:hypothetical protein
MADLQINCLCRTIQGNSYVSKVNVGTRSSAEIRINGHDLTGMAELPTLVFFEANQAQYK